MQAGQTVVILGGAGNVGGYAVQLAQQAGGRVVAMARLHDFDRLRSWSGRRPGAGAEAFLWLRRVGLLVSAVGAGPGCRLTP